MGSCSSSTRQVRVAEPTFSSIGLEAMGSMGWWDDGMMGCYDNDNDRVFFFTWYSNDAVCLPAQTDHQISLSTEVL